MPARSLLHVGWPKTATTYLQAHVLPALEGLSYLGKPYAPGPLAAAMRNLQSMDSVALPRTDALAVLRRHLHAVGGPVVLSTEGLCMSTGGGGFYAHADRALIAERLLEAFGADARILFTIREQMSWLESYYLYHVSGHVYTGRFVTATEWFARQHALPAHGAILAADYWPTIDAYRRLFGAQNVLVLPFEQIAADMPEACRQIAAFCGASYPAGWQPPQERVRERPAARALAFAAFNRYFLSDAVRAAFARTVPRRIKRSFKTLLGGGARARADFSPYAEVLRALYGPGNRALEEALGLPLGRLGYLMAPQVPAP